MFNSHFDAFVEAAFCPTVSDLGSKMSPDFIWSKLNVPEDSYPDIGADETTITSLLTYRKPCIADSTMYISDLMGRFMSCPAQVVVQEWPFLTPAALGITSLHNECEFLVQRLP